MDDKEIGQLKAALRAGLTLFLRADVSVPEPGSLARSVMRWVPVAAIADKPDPETGHPSPVAYYNDGTGHYAELWNVERRDVVVCAEVRVA